jgi:hypothetical protein
MEAISHGGYDNEGYNTESFDNEGLDKECAGFAKRSRFNKDGFAKEGCGSFDADTIVSKDVEVHKREAEEGYGRTDLPIAKDRPDAGGPADEAPMEESDSSEKSGEESENETNSKVIVKSGKSSEESVANEKSSKEKSGCSTAKKQWRCYHCWSNLESERVICRYCKDKTVAIMFELVLEPT